MTTAAEATLQQFAPLTMTFTKVTVVYGGELAEDVAKQVQSICLPAKVELRNASDSPKLLLNRENELVCFLMQTIENSSATEEGGVTLRFFKRKTHPSNLCQSMHYTVLGLGDSNLLLDRQTTSAIDCNQVAQELDSRLEALGGRRFHELGLSDERTGLQEVAPWIQQLCLRIASEIE